MSTDNSEVLNAINRLVESQTFSMQAVEQIARLREQAAADKKTIDHLNDENDRLNKLYLQTRTEIANQETRIKVLLARIEGFEKREAAMIESEKASAVAEAKIESYREVVGMVFKNTEIRRNIQRTVAMPAPSINSQTGMQAYPSVHTAHDSETTSEG